MLVQQAITLLTSVQILVQLPNCGKNSKLSLFPQGIEERQLVGCCLQKLMMLVQNQPSIYYHLQSQSVQYQMSKHFRSNLTHWLAKVNSLTRRSRKTSNANKKLNEVEPKEPKYLNEEMMTDFLIKLFQEAKARGESCQSGREIIMHFLREEQLSITNKMHDTISQLIERFFLGGEEQSRNHQDYVGNVWNSNTSSYQCICPRTTRDLQFSQPKEVCYRCNRSCHTNCLWGKDNKDELYECPLCFLTNCLPNKEVQQILFAGFLRQIKKDKIEYKINLPLENIALDQLQVEARCVRLCKDNKYDIGWPINSVLLLNGKKIMDFKPLGINSSLKRRTDDEITFERRLLEKQNTIIIEEKHQYIEGYRPAVYENHFVVLVLVKSLSVEQMLPKLMESKISVEESKETLRQYFNRGSQDCVIEQINVSLRCQLYNLRITIPSRSKHCTSHYQPFDLRSFLISNINLKSSTQRWRCPICRQRAYHLIVDQHLFNFIQERPNVDIIEFASTGQPKFFENEQSDNESQRNQVNEKPVKELEVIQCEEEIKDKQLKPPKQVQERNYSQCIQIQSEIEDNQQPAKKRMFSERFFENLTDELDNNSLQKKRKTEEEKESLPLFPREKDVEQREPAREESVSSSELINFESKYSPENSSYNFKPGKKEKKQRGRRREQPEEERKEVEKMAKVLIPSPAISTVTPEAIRILQKKIPDFSKRPQLAPPIEIESDEQGEEFKRERKMQHHRMELAREKGCLIQRNQKCDITAADESIFLSLCDKFMIGSVRS